MARRWLDSGKELLSPAAGTDSAPPAPPSQSDLHRLAVKIAIFGNVLVVVLLFVAVIWRLFFSGKGEEGVMDPEEEGGGSSGIASPSVEPKVTGIGELDLMAPAVHVHRAAEDGGGGKQECAVCLCEFGDGDDGCLLPRCGHRFHAKCVDRWFRSQASCPLCRVVVANTGSGERKARSIPSASL